MQKRFVLFYADWCTHSRKILPVWIKLEEKYGFILIVKFEDMAHREVMVKNGIQGFPTMKFFNGDRSIEYEGDRTFDSLEEFFLKNMNN